jgi:hypothetical protein
MTYLTYVLAVFFITFLVHISFPWFSHVLFVEAKLVGDMSS